ncbi:MAG: molecular chaperone [Pseudomonadales bacterium]
MTGPEHCLAAGFDYGTSQCSIGIVRDGAVALLALEGGLPRIASTLYAPRPHLNLDHRSDQTLDLTHHSYAELRFGQAALDAYLADPAEGYFVKSPKSFLGAPGLSQAVRDRFVAVVAAMMANVRARAETAAGRTIGQVVIGRPVNFQGAGGEAENRQALEMLVASAHEAGFRDVAFQFEPMAAAIEYEARLNHEQTVLVVDIGGGTTDCSFVRVGPERRSRRQRDDDVLGHSGERLGGNDYDQALALRSVMPLFGLGDGLNNGLPFPNGYFVDAVSTNDVNAQQRFYGRAMAERLDLCVRDGTHAERIRRLRKLQAGRGSYRLLREVELAKIALTGEDQAVVDLAFVESGLAAACSRADLRRGSARLLEHLAGLIDEACRQAGARPDVVYLTGGMAGSAVVREHLARVLDDVPRVDSDHFASVTQGLTLWAQRVFAQ